MARKAFPIRLDEADLDRLAIVAAKMQVSKTEIVEAGLRARLDLLEGYAAMDAGPPKSNTVPLMISPGLPPKTLKPRRGVPVQITGGARAIRGYAVDGSPIYR